MSVNKLNNIYRRFISTSTDATTIDRIIDKGIAYTLESEGQEAIYVIGSVEQFLKYAAAVGGLGSDKISIYGSETRLTQTEEVWEENSGTIWMSPSRENDSFLPSVMKIKSLMDNDQVLMDKGIIEFDSKIDSEGTNYGEISILDRFLIKQLPLLVDEDNDYDSIISRILDKGLVISQKNDTCVIASIETYLKFAEASGAVTPA